MTDDMPAGWEQADSTGSYNDAIAELRRRHVLRRKCACGCGKLLARNFREGFSRFLDRKYMNRNHYFAHYGYKRCRVTELPNYHVRGIRDSSPPLHTVWSK